MKKYIKPIIVHENVETTDIVTSSGIVDNGQSYFEDTNGNVITGIKGSFTSSFDSIF